MNVFVVAALLAFQSTMQVAPTGWEFAGVTASRPALSYYEKGRPRLVMTCSDFQTSVQVRGFDAAQQWPQPTLSIKFHAVERAATPNLAMIGDQTAFTINFPISDSVLASLRDGAAITASYRGQTHSFPLIPKAYRTDFVEKCAALVPAGMRKS